MSDLNAEQLAVVNSDAKMICCVAGPGSGKTHTMCARISKQISDGANPKSFLIITYTNAAADEIQKRIGSQHRLGYIGTLHGFLFRILTQHGNDVGLPANLSIIDEDAKEGIIDSIIEELGVKASAKNVLPLLKNEDLITMSTYARAKSFTKPQLCAIEYHARLRRSGLLDFDTILFYGERLIKKISETAKASWTYKYVYWDEGQDGSDEDFRILEALPCEFKTIFSDPDQSIYGFRGAKPENILTLCLTVSEIDLSSKWTVFKLEKNYRCKSKICRAAQTLIERNPDRVPKETVAHESGGTVVVEAFDSPGEELAFIANELTRARNGNGRPEDGYPAKIDELKETAILCRTNYLAEQFSAYLEGLGVPAAKKKPVSVPPDWRKARMLLTVIANPFNDMAVHQFLVLEKGKSAADVLRRDAAKNMVSLYDHVKDSFFAGWECKDYNDRGITLTGLSHESRERIHDACRQLPVGWTVQDLILFLASGEAEAQQIGAGVYVGTVHSAKGKEWDQVFLCGVEHPWYPGRDSLAESRRLLYVGLTRARRRVVLTWVKARPQWRGANVRPGPMEDRVPSQFLFEMGL